MKKKKKGRFDKVVSDPFSIKAVNKVCKSKFKIALSCLETISVTWGTWLK